MLKKNILYNFVYQFLIMFLPFVTAPYLSRILGAEGIGIYSYSYSTALYFIYFSLLGLNNYGNRTIAGTQGGRRQLSKTFSELFCMQLITALLSTAFYLVYILLFATNKVAAMCQLIFVASSILDINWFFFGIEKFKLTVIRNTIVKLGTVLCIFLFVKVETDVNKYIIIMALGTLISNLVLWRFLRQYVDFKIARYKDIIKHIRPNLMMFIPVIAVSIYKVMDKIMLGNMGSIASVGYFENAEKIINVPVALIIAVGTVMLPRISSYVAAGKRDDVKRYFDVFMMIVLAFANAATFGIISISNEFVDIFYGKDFSQTAIIMEYLAVTIIFLAAGNVLRTQYLIPEKRDSVYIISAILGAIVNFVINLALIPRLDAVGAAIGTIFAELVVCGYQFLAAKKEIRLLKYLKWESIFLIAGLLMYFIINNIQYDKNIYISLFIKIIIGGSSYFIIVYFLILRKFIKTLGK
ncbi:Membrane protein involved in the export of O-antigen and teichoic acid [Bacillus sp. OV166]|uniref:flippase n=1 Tax=Bacillus sp. OV166 TaxID=1882763 RepID=UPI000A2AE198|nr:flippase [Bacillus sp. OV166]SMQ85070.1 Membrane protein involved in the export of O-antigen and teichoic acid [Bacillus sp. OV166]